MLCTPPSDSVPQPFCSAAHTSHFVLDTSSSKFGRNCRIKTEMVEPARRRTVPSSWGRKGHRLLEAIELLLRLAGFDAVIVGGPMNSQKALPKSSLIFPRPGPHPGSSQPGKLHRSRRIRWNRRHRRSEHICPCGTGKIPEFIESVLEVELRRELRRILPEL